jgi:hypothetical protein
MFSTPEFTRCGQTGKVILWRDRKAHHDDAHDGDGSPERFAISSWRTLYHTNAQ